MRKWELSKWTVEELEGHLQSCERKLEYYKNLLGNSTDMFECGKLSEKIKDYEIDIGLLIQELESRY